MRPGNATRPRRACHRKVGPLVAVLIIVILLAPAVAQTIGDQWSLPVLVFDPFEHVVHDASLAADAGGQLHAFISYGGYAGDAPGTDEGLDVAYPDNVIMYLHGDGRTWSQPVDIIVNEEKSKFRNAQVNAVADKFGTLHMVLSYAPLLYRRARIGEAGSARGWEPARRGYWGFRVLNARLAASGDGTVHLVYSTEASGQGPGNVYYTYSTDGGDTWSPEINVSRIERPTVTADDVDVVVDERGIVNVVWSVNEFPGGYPPMGVYYSRSEDSGGQWSTPLELGGQYASRPAVAVVGTDEIHVVWGSSVQDRGRYYRHSSDRGLSWSDVDLVARFTTGITPDSEQLLVDSAGQVHWILTDDFGAFHLVLSAGAWSEPERIAKSWPDLPAGWPWGRGPYDNYAVVTQGNKLNLLTGDGFGATPGQGQQTEGMPDGWFMSEEAFETSGKIWYTSLVADAPYEAPGPIAVREVTPSPGPTEKSMPTATPQPTAVSTRLPKRDLIRPRSPVPLTHSPALPVLAAVVPVTALILVVAFWRAVGNRRE